jgi:glyoxylase-like metal-dependent hydrolase (beta-lactamase superfamily II)
MAAPTPELRFATDFDPQTGQPVPVAPGVVRVTAPNTGPFTFKGTNSYIIGAESVAVLDPGPDDGDHLDALLAAIGGRKVDAILLSHTHTDHSALVPRLQAATEAPVWSGGRHRLSRPRRPFELNPVGRESDWRHRPDRVLRDNEQFVVGGVGLEAITTPGHCANHLAFGIPGTAWLFSGDHIMGWNSTLVAVPDGSMAEYLASLEKVIGLSYSRYLPAHGGVIADGPAYASALLAHRAARNRQVVDAVKSGVRRVRDLLGPIYPGLAPPLHGAALMTLRAHAEYLADRGEISVTYRFTGMTLFPAGG